MRGGYPEEFVLVTQGDDTNPVSRYENLMILKEVQNYILQTKKLFLGIFLSSSEQIGQKIIVLNI